MDERLVKLLARTCGNPGIGKELRLTTLINIEPLLWKWHDANFGSSALKQRAQRRLLG